MQATEARAEVFLTAFHSLTKKERGQILNKLLDDPKFMEDFLDIAVYYLRKDDPTFAYNEFRVGRQKKGK